MLVNPILAVMGARSTSSSWKPEMAWVAARVGRWAADRGLILACGGLTGAGREAVYGAREIHGLTLALTPGLEDESGAQVVVRTNLGVYRNFTLAFTGHFGVAIGGSYGTIQEAAQFADLKKPVAAVMAGWRLPGVPCYDTYEDLEREFLASLKW